MRLHSVSSVFPVLAALATLALVPTSGGAQDADAPASTSTPRFSLDGFGTLGLTHSSEDEADFAPNPLRPSGPGHSGALSPDVDSRLGAQLTAAFTSKLTVVVQVVAEQTHEDDYAPGLEWAYVDYSFTSDLALRAGRSPVNTFLASEFQKVSYAYPWMRPPGELYGLSPISRREGVEGTWRRHTGDWTTELEASFSRAEGEFPGGKAEAGNVLTVDASARKGGFSGRVAFTRGELAVDAFDSLFDAFREFGPEGVALADRYEVNDTPFHLASLAAEYDRGRWFGTAELGWVDFNSVLGEKLAGYVTTGYRLGRFTPYATYSRVDLLSESEADGLTVSGFPPDAAAAAAGLNSQLDSFLGGAARQQNVAFGGRWDVVPGLALKLQFDFIDLHEESFGTFINHQPDFEPGGSARLVSLAAVFVF